jgi:arylsulfatase A-like enzyme
MPETRPNLLLILTDQQRWDTLGAGGNSAIHTPNLDRLAARGVSFGQAFSPAPVCAPARAALLTGLTPSRLHFTANEGSLERDTETIAHWLGAAGYSTTALGKMHFTAPKGSAVRPWELTGGFQHRVISEETRWARQARSLAEVGFDDYDRYLIERGLWGWGTPPEIGYNEIKPVISALPEEHGVTAWLGRLAADWLRQPPSAPFFLFASFVKPHAPYDPPLEWAGLYDPAAVPTPVRSSTELGRANPHYAEERRWREWRLYSDFAGQQARAHYYANISLIDKYIGQMLDALEASGQADNTFVIFASDHGDMLGDHWAWFKNLAYDGAARVPLLLAGPGLPAGVRADASVVTLHDVTATLLSRAGLPIPAGCPGRDLGDFVQPAAPARREMTVIEVNKPGQRTRAARTPDWLYVHWENGGFEELYDLRADPGQLHDLSAEPAFAATRRDLRAAVVDWLREWGDPDWELDAHGGLSEHEYRPRREARWLPRPHGREPFHTAMAPAAWTGDDDKLWFWRELGGDYSKLLEFVRAQAAKTP